MLNRKKEPLMSYLMAWGKIDFQSAVVESVLIEYCVCEMGYTSEMLVVFSVFYNPQTQMI